MQCVFCEVEKDVAYKYYLNATQGKRAYIDLAIRLETRSAQVN